MPETVKTCARCRKRKRLSPHITCARCTLSQRRKNRQIKGCAAGGTTGRGKPPAFSDRQLRALSALGR